MKEERGEFSEGNSHWFKDGCDTSPLPTLHSVRLQMWNSTRLKSLISHLLIRIENFWEDTMEHRRVLNVSTDLERTTMHPLVLSQSFEILECFKSSQGTCIVFSWSLICQKLDSEKHKVKEWKRSCVYNPLGICKYFSYLLCLICLFSNHSDCW